MGKQGYTFFDGKKAINAWDVDDLTGWTVLGDRGTEARYFASVPWLYRAVKDRSNNVARMPFSIMRGDEEVDSSGKYSNALTFLPNPRALFSRIEMSVAMTGKAYLIIERNRGGYVKGLKYCAQTSIT